MSILSVWDFTWPNSLGYARCSQAVSFGDILFSHVGKAWKHGAPRNDGEAASHPLFSYRKLRWKPSNLQANREELSTLDASDGRPWVSSTSVNISSMPVDFFKGGRVKWWLHLRRWFPWLFRICSCGFPHVQQCRQDSTRMPRTRLDREVTEGAGFEEKRTFEKTSKIEPSWSVCQIPTCAKLRDLKWLVWFGLAFLQLAFPAFILSWMHSVLY